MSGRSILYAKVSIGDRAIEASKLHTLYRNLESAFVGVS